jgi:transcriptional regulator with XRE-family HTH domain
MALFDILPFDLEDDGKQLDRFLQGPLWGQISAYQCLRLLKLLDVEQQSIATYLGVTMSSVSMWVNRVRSVPAKYQAAIRAYTAIMLQQAWDRKYKEWLVLPPPLRLAAVMEWWAGWRRWELEAQHEEGVLHARVQAECRQVGAYAAHTTLTAEDRQALRRLCSTLQTQLRTLDELETSPEEQPSEASGG